MCLLIICLLFWLKSWRLLFPEGIRIHYYDIYILSKLQAENIDPETLAYALHATVKKRGTISAVKQYRKIIEAVRSSEVMKRQWNNYRKNFDYAADIEFEETCDVVIRIMESLPNL